MFSEAYDAALCSVTTLPAWW